MLIILNLFIFLSIITSSISAKYVNPYYNSLDGSEKSLWNDLERTFPEQVDALLLDVETNHNTENISASLASYNNLRHLLNKPSATKIGQEWLDEIKCTIQPFLFLEVPGVRSSQGDEATEAQKELVHEALRNLEIDKDLLVIGGVDGRSWENQIMVPYKPNLDTRLYKVYHEIGHIVHEDFLNEKYRANNPDIYFTELEVNHDLMKIKMLVQQGETAFDQSTHTGRHINSILNAIQNALKNMGKPDNVYWERQIDDENYTSILIKRSYEYRADLFMLNALYKNRMLTPILEFIQTMGTSNDIIARKSYDADDYPSDFERALYAAGFLVKALAEDIAKEESLNNQKALIKAHEKFNKLLFDFENAGTCIDAEAEYASKKSPQDVLFETSQGTTDFLKAYSKWLVADYENVNKNSPRLHQRLLHQIRLCLQLLWEDPYSKRPQTGLILAYNYLSKLLDQPQRAVTSTDQIDKNWLAQLEKSIK